MPGVSRLRLCGDKRVIFGMTRNILTGVLMLLLLAPLSKAQEPPNEAKGWEIPDAPLNCEMNMLYMDMLSQMVLGQTKSGGMLVAVARLGAGEKSRESNRRRLYNVREYIKDRTGVGAEKIVVAEGERVNGVGRVEFYLGGKKVGGLLLGRNKDLCLLCCEEVGPYYPHRDNLERKRRRK